MFFPPPGAMQFEVTLMRRPETRAMVGTAIWVRAQTKEEKTAEGEHSLCGCDDGWVVLAESVAGEPRKFLEERQRSGAILMVCPCTGRIIE